MYGSSRATISVSVPCKKRSSSFYRSSGSDLTATFKPVSSLRFDSNVNSPAPTATLAHRVAVTKYGARFWAVWIDAELVAVTVYKNGAVRVAELLQGMRFQKYELSSYPEGIGRRRSRMG